MQFRRRDKRVQVVSVAAAPQHGEAFVALGIGCVAGDLAMIVDAVTERPGSAADRRQVMHFSVPPQEPVEVLVRRPGAAGYETSLADPAREAEVAAERA